MWITKQIVLGLCQALLMVNSGCRSGPPPSPEAGVTLQPGRYLEGFYFTPGFVPEEAAFAMEPFALEEVSGLDRHAFQEALQTGMARAFAANGLKLKPGPGACRVSGTVRRVAVQGAVLRAFLGKMSLHLEISGVITREGQTLFAFSDRLKVTSPLNPGPAAPKERELLAQQALRAFFHHLLTEMLSYRTSEPG